MMIATPRLPVCNTHFQLPVYMQRVTFDPYCCDNANSILAALGVPGRPRNEVLINAWKHLSTQRSFKSAGHCCFFNAPSFDLVVQNSLFSVSDERLTPCQAAMHPFLAPEFPFRYLLSQQGCESEGLLQISS